MELKKQTRRLGPCELDDPCRCWSFIELNKGLLSLGKLTHERSLRRIAGNVIDRRASSERRNAGTFHPTDTVYVWKTSRWPGRFKRYESRFRGHYHWRQCCYRDRVLSNAPVAKPPIVMGICGHYTGGYRRRPPPTRKPEAF